MEFNTICVIGLGYIGLPTATMFASRRKKVVGVDINQKAVDTINRGEIHIVEPELDIAVHAAVKEGYLRATTQPEPADAFLVAVPTPFKKGKSETEVPQPDLAYIQAAAESIAPVLEKGNLVILESTSPVGATEQLAEWLREARPDLSFPQDAGESADILIAHCPERVLPGRVMLELIENDRIVGGMTSRCAKAACELYGIFVRGKCFVTDTRTAEMAKLTENAFRDVNIAFANELSILCERMNINVWDLIDLANRHPRVNILQPGPGVGGHCIAVDPWFIISSQPEAATLIHSARKVNNSKPGWVIEEVRKKVREVTARPDKENSQKIKIACYGMTFKADIDDFRESPSLDIALQLAKEFPERVIFVEPNNEGKLEQLAPDVPVLDIKEALSVADLNIFLVPHKQFKENLREINIAKGESIFFCKIGEAG